MKPEFFEDNSISINNISQVVDDWDEFEQWCQVRECDERLAYDIMCLSRDAEHADEIHYEGPDSYKTINLEVKEMWQRNGY